MLATSCFEATSFLPEIYNEDWLFFYDDARARRLGWSGRNATQLQYDPFSQPQRAERQEFGDVLAEGLYALLHLGAGAAVATAEYWKDFLTAREKWLPRVDRLRVCGDIGGLLAYHCQANSNLRTGASHTRFS